MNQLPLFLVLRSRWKESLAVFLGIMILGNIMLRMVKPQYTATTSLMLRAAQDPLSPDRNGAYATPPAIFVATQVDLFKSPRIAAATMDGLDGPALQWIESQWNAAKTNETLEQFGRNLISRGLKVRFTRESSMVEADLTLGDPVAAAALLNRYADRFIETAITIETQPSDHYRDAYGREMAAARTRLQEAQKALADYQSKTGLLLEDTRFDAEVSRLNDLTSKVVALQGAVAEAKGRLAAGSPSDRPVNAGVDPVLANLYEGLQAASAELTEAQSTLGARNPTVVALKEKVDSFNRQIAAQNNRLKGDLGASLKSLQAQLTSVQELEATQRKRVLDLNAVRAKGSTLEREAKAATESYDRLLGAIQTASVQSRVRPGDGAVVEKASVPTQPSFPKSSIAMIGIAFLATLCALLWALLREYRDRRFRTSPQLLGLTPAPLPFQIPMMDLKEVATTREPRPRLLSSDVRTSK